MNDLKVNENDKLKLYLYVNSMVLSKILFKKSINNIIHYFGVDTFENDNLNLIDYIPDLNQKIDIDTIALHFCIKSEDIDYPKSHYVYADF